MMLRLGPTPAMRLWQWGVLALLLVACAGLRWREAVRSSLQPDEVYAMELATGRGPVHVKVPRGVVVEAVPAMARMEGAGAWWTVPGSLRESVYPPAYFTLLGALRRLADGAGPARGMSLVFGVVGVWVFFGCVRRLVGNSAGLWAVAIVALSRPGAETGVEVRPYALLMLAAAVALRGWVGVAQGLRPRAWAWVLFTGVLGMEVTHYFGFGLALSMGVMSLVLLRGRERVLSAGAVLGATGVFAVVWGGALYGQFAGGWFAAGGDANVYLVREGPSLLRVLEWTATLPARLMVIVRFDRSSGAYWAALLAGGIWVLPWVMARRVPGAAVLGFCAVGGVLAPVCLDLFRGTGHLEYLRYVVLALPPVAGIVGCLPGWLGTFLTGRAARLASVIPAAACFAAANSLPAEFGERREDQAGLARIIDAHVPPGALLIFTGDADAGSAYVPRYHLLLYEYYGRRDGGRGAARAVVLARSPLTSEVLAEVRRRTAAGGYVWTASEQGSESPMRVLPGLVAVPGVGGVVGGAGQVVAFRFPEDVVRATTSP